VDDVGRGQELAVTWRPGGLDELDEGPGPGKSCPSWIRAGSSSRSSCSPSPNTATPGGSRPWSAVRADHPELAQAAIAVVRAHPDPYLRERLAYDLGESPLIPCKPHPTATP